MKILVMDDSVFIQNIISKALKDNFPDAQILVCNNGLSGYELYLDSRPDVIITDLLMPEMTGQELVQRIRETDPTTKIIVISADIQKATRNEMESFSISGFINKPINGEKIVQLIHLIKEVPNA